jgi:hypothetical protein
MKTLLKLITLSAAAVIAYKAYENNKKKNEVREIIKIEPQELILPELTVTTRLEDALVQSFKVQTKVMIDSYPRDHSIDISHTISFIDDVQLEKYAKYLSKENTNHEKNMDDLSINLRNTIKTDAQEAFNDIIKVAESTLDYHGIYQGWVFENLK